MKTTKASILNALVFKENIIQTYSVSLHKGNGFV